MKTTTCVLTLTLICAAGLLTGTSLQAQLPSQLQTLVDAEREFASTTRTTGIRDGFLQFFAPDAIALEPGPESAFEQLRQRPSRPFSEQELTWDPRAGGIAASGEIGWLTGPSTFVDRRSGGKPQYGNYLSIWRRRDGVWKVFIDRGVSTPAEVPFAQEFQVVQVRPPYAGPSGDAVRALETADRRLNERIAQIGMAGAYAPVLMDHSRLLHDGAMSATGRDAVLAALRREHGRWTVLMTKVETARSADLGYAYGTWDAGAAAKPPRGGYLRIWGRDHAGVWQLLADVIF